MKNLFNNMDSSEIGRILEMHKKKGYGTINEQTSAAGGFDIERFARPGGRPTDPKAFKNPFTPQPQQNTNPNSKPLTPNQQKAAEAGYGSMTPEAADKLAKETNNFQIKKNTKEVDANLYSITRTGKLIPKKGMGGQFCYAIPAASISSIKADGKTNQEEITYAKTNNVSPWTDVQQFFRNNDLGQCRTNDEAGLSDPMGKYVSIGSKGPFVKTIQLKLANYSEQYAASLHAAKKNDYKVDPIDGNFGKVTSRLVKDYQSHEGISPADGRVRKNTWDSLKNIRTANIYDVNTQKWEPAGGKVEALQGIKAKSVTPTDTNEPTLKV